MGRRRVGERHVSDDFSQLATGSHRCFRGAQFTCFTRTKVQILTLCTSQSLRTLIAPAPYTTDSRQSDRVRRRRRGGVEKRRRGGGQAGWEGHLPRALGGGTPGMVVNGRVMAAGRGRGAGGGECSKLRCRHLRGACAQMLDML
jgi:hypothetical protein